MLCFKSPWYHWTCAFRQIFTVHSSSLPVGEMVQLCAPYLKQWSIGKISQNPKCHLHLSTLLRLRHPTRLSTSKQRPWRVWENRHWSYQVRLRCATTWHGCAWSFKWKGKGLIWKGLLWTDRMLAANIKDLGRRKPEKCHWDLSGMMLLDRLRLGGTLQNGLLPQTLSLYDH